MFWHPLTMEQEPNPRLTKQLCMWALLWASYPAPGICLSKLCGGLGLSMAKGSMTQLPVWKNSEALHYQAFPFIQRWACVRVHIHSQWQILLWPTWHLTHELNKWKDKAAKGHPINWKHKSKSNHSIKSGLDWNHVVFKHWSSWFPKDVRRSVNT
jgi:hypothetical protein